MARIVHVLARSGPPTKDRHIIATTTSVRSDEYDAWLFDLDGVITDTAAVHASAWKRTFDEYLKARAARDGTEFRPFEIDPDYYEWVDGKPRYDGVDSFLRSRGIVLERGDPSDPPERETCCGIGNRKNELFNDVLAEEGCIVFDTSVDLVRTLKAQGKRVAVVSSSKNCTTALKAAGLTDLFEARVDGLVAAERGLKGKPDGETYLEAARMLGATAERSVVIEDAISGVQAGRNGRFGLVIGIARHDDPQTLLDNGADVVVTDLVEIELT